MPTRSGYHRDVHLALNPRQRDVLRLIAQGKTNPEIADALGIGYESVKSYVSDVLSKLGVDRREEAAAWWHEERSLRRRAARFGAAILVLVPRGAGAVATGAALLVGAAVVTATVVARSGDDGAPAALATPVTGPYPLGTRTGISSVDAAIAAVESGDRAQLHRAWHFFLSPCAATSTSARGWLPTRG